jgi:hypothetical protein
LVLIFSFFGRGIVEFSFRHGSHESFKKVIQVFDSIVTLLVLILSAVVGKIFKESVIVLLLLLFIYISIYLYSFILTAKGFLRGGSETTIRHTTQRIHISKITHRAETKHSTQNYTNNRGHTAHSEYNAKTINRYYS